MPGCSTFTGAGSVHSLQRPPTVGQHPSASFRASPTPRPSRPSAGAAAAPRQRQSACGQPESKRTLRTMGIINPVVGAVRGAVGFVARPFAGGRATKQVEPAKEDEIEQLVLKLHEIEAVKFGQFKLKSGLTSPVYIDLRIIVSFPDVLKQVSRLMWSEIQTTCKFDVICGVPYTALPIATCMSLEYGAPMLMRRKEVKDYGTKKAIEGAFKPGQRCLIIEDLVTSGASVLETLEPLQEVELKVSDVVVLIDREQGGKAFLESKGMNLYSGFKLSFILDVLQKHKLVDDATASQVLEFIAANQTFNAGAQPAAPKPEVAKAPSKPKRLTYKERAKLAKNAMGTRMFETMARKKTNLSVAADYTSAEKVLELADKIGPHICCLKTHVDQYDTWNDDLASRLQEISKKHDFVIFEDRKFADIGNTVVAQYGAGIYKIANWSDITNAHLVPGTGIIDGLKSVGAPKGRGLLLLAEMSSKGTLAKGQYTTEVAKAAEANLEFVMGFISTDPAHWESGPTSPGLIHMTPGVQLASGGDNLGQQYNTPDMVIGERGSDVIIVGRGVIKADAPAAAAEQYKKAGWAAYEAALK
mmetsp:Transcript_40560/g.114874  ORF Transcript_40560/g.114874 Transcript_40560/m.114874 type:complete len:586 (-) Transcript_40560:432-2189(-)